MTDEEALELLKSVGLVAQLMLDKTDDVSISGHQALSEDDLAKLSVAPGTTINNFWIYRKDSKWFAVTEMGDIDHFHMPCESFDEAVSTIVAFYRSDFVFGQDGTMPTEAALDSLANCVPAVYFHTSADGSNYIHGGVETDKPFQFYRYFQIGTRGALYIIALSKYPITYGREFWHAKTLQEAVKLLCEKWSQPLIAT